ncbi:hypothetical protein OSK28_25890, partial [Escherichia coli]|nr:hypothetical protein [Escherichia coli]
ETVQRQVFQIGHGSPCLTLPQPPVQGAITLASGEYIFEYVGQGADGDELYAEVMDSEGNIIAKGDNVTLTGWKNWKTPSVSFKLEKETKV